MKILLISIDLVLGTRILTSLLKTRYFTAKNLQIVGVRYSDTFSKKALRDIYDFSKEYDVIGLSFNSFYSLLAAQLGTYLKSRGIRWLIAGGPHTTAMPEEVVSYADIAVIHEAEITLPALLNHLGDPASLRDIHGIVFKDESGRINRTGSPIIENDLDAIPHQTFSSEDIAYYDVTKDSFEKPALDNLFPGRGRNYFIITSRGCPFKCAYCSNNLFAKINEESVNIRKRSVPNIIHEMKLAKKRGLQGFYIADDNFLAFTLEEIEDFSKQYSSMINLPFGIGGLNPNNMRSGDSVKKIELLLESGLSDVRIGVQSGSDKTLKIFKRGYAAGALPKLLSVFEKRTTIWKAPNDKLRVAVDFICDAPWENEKDKLSTLKLANDLLTTYGIFFYTLIYLPGTDIYELALKKGWLKNRKKDIYLRGIAGVEDTIYNRLLFLIAVLHERGSRLPDEIMSLVLKLHKKDQALAEGFIDFIIKLINDVEGHHCLDLSHLTLHPYLTGFNKWEKTAGEAGKRVLFRSYHTPYG